MAAEASITALSATVAELEGRIVSIESEKKSADSTVVEREAEIKALQETVLWSSTSSLPLLNIDYDLRSQMYKHNSAPPCPERKSSASSLRLQNRNTLGSWRKASLRARLPIVM